MLGGVSSVPKHGRHNKNTKNLAYKCPKRFAALWKKKETHLPPMTYSGTRFFNACCSIESGLHDQDPSTHPCVTPKKRNSRPCCFVVPLIFQILFFWSGTKPVRTGAYRSLCGSICCLEISQVYIAVGARDPSPPGFFISLFEVRHPAAGIEKCAVPLAFEQ